MQLGISKGIKKLCFLFSQILYFLQTSQLRTKRRTSKNIPCQNYYFNINTAVNFFKNGQLIKNREFIELLGCGEVRFQAPIFSSEKKTFRYC